VSALAFLAEVIHTLNSASSDRTFEAEDETKIGCGTVDQVIERNQWDFVKAAGRRVDVRVFEA
jgi:hypothetical protein